MESVVRLLHTLSFYPIFATNVAILLLYLDMNARGRFLVRGDFL